MEYQGKLKSNKTCLLYIVSSLEGTSYEKAQDTALCDCNGTRTHNHLICKRTLNHLAKLAKWLSVHLQIKRVVGSSPVAVT